MNQSLLKITLMGVVFMAGFAQAKERTLNNGNLQLKHIPEIPEVLKAQLNRYQNVRSAGFVDWAEDGGIYISTRFGDVSQLHRVSQPGGNRYQMTFLSEPIGGVSKQPNGRMLTYTMDAGGSEFAQIFLLDPQTGESKMLSDGESRNGAVSVEQCRYLYRIPKYPSQWCIQRCVDDEYRQHRDRRCGSGITRRHLVGCSGLQQRRFQIADCQLHQCQPVSRLSAGCQNRKSNTFG